MSRSIILTWQLGGGSRRSRWSSLFPDRQVRRRVLVTIWFLAAAMSTSAKRIGGRMIVADAHLPLPVALPAAVGFILLLTFATGALFDGLALDRPGYLAAQLPLIALGFLITFHVLHFLIASRWRTLDGRNHLVGIGLTVDRYRLGPVYSYQTIRMSAERRGRFAVHVSGLKASSFLCLADSRWKRHSARMGWFRNRLEARRFAERLARHCDAEAFDSMARPLPTGRAA